METERVQYKIGLAEKIVAVETPYTRSYRMCRDYLTDGEPDIRVSISETDIQHERDEAEEIQTAGYLETLAVYRKIAEAMVDARSCMSLSLKSLSTFTSVPDLFSMKTES